MVFRGITLAVLLLGVLAGRLVCPCAPETAKPVQQAAAHSCCHKEESKPAEPCPKHGPGCTHCGTILAPADKVVEAPAPAVVQDVFVSLIDLLPPTPVVKPVADAAIVDPSPPSRLSLYCILLT